MKNLIAPRALRRATLLTAGLLAAGMMMLVSAQIPQQQVTFAKGADKATLQGSLKGPNQDTRDYVLRLKGGQMLSVTMQTKNTSTYFNVLPPGSPEALYRGKVEGNARWEGQVSVDGDYTVRVFLNRTAARKGASSSYTLTIAAF